MKAKIYTEIICKGFCKYYKEGKEELHCNGYVFLRNNFTPYELKILLDIKNVIARSGATKQSPHLEIASPEPAPSDTTRFLANARNDMGEGARNDRLDEELKNLICAKCDFFIDECDYTDNHAGPPCGGYIIINLLCG
jgi:hypothetical protein